jgi:hypothetical protein
MAAVVVRNRAMTGPDFTPIKAELVVTKIFISTSPSSFRQDHQPCADMSIQQVRLIQRCR